MLYFPRFYKFFSVSSFCIKLVAIEICYFFTFLSVWLFREWVGKVNLSFFYVFLLNLGFFTRFFFLNLLFLFWSHIVGCGFVKLARVDSSILLQCYIFFIFLFFFIFDIRLLGLELYNFFLLSFPRVVSISYPKSYFSRFNLICLWLSSPKYLF